MGKLKKFLRKKQRNNKATKSRKKRQHNNKKKAAPDPKKWDAFNNSENVCKLPPPEPVSKDYLDDLMAASGVSYTNAHYCPPLSGADPKYWDALMKAKEDYKLPPPEPVKDYFDALSVQYQVTYTSCNDYPPYTAVADPKRWDASMKAIADYKLTPPQSFEDFRDALSAQYQAALGVTYTSCNYYPPYTAVADPKRWDASMKAIADYKLTPPQSVEDFRDALSAQYQAALGVTYTKTPPLISHYQP